MDVIDKHSRRIEYAVGRTASVLLPTSVLVIYLSILVGGVLGFILGMEATSITEITGLHTQGVGEFLTEEATNFENYDPSIVGIVLYTIVHSLLTISLAFGFTAASITAHIAYHSQITIPVMALNAVFFLGVIPAIVYVAWNLVTVVDSVYGKLKSYRHSVA